jgi:F-type H+-transporting ATPase subunit delta
LLRDPAARRYAEAAFGLARDRGELETWEQQLDVLMDALRSPGAMGFLASAQAPASAKLEFLERVLEQPAPHVRNLLRILAEKNKVALLPQVIEGFRGLLDEERGIAHASVVTAVAMSDAERDAVARRLSEMTGKQIQIHPRVDEQILGGLVARIGDRLIDGSTRTKLIALKRQLAGRTR